MIGRPLALAGMLGAAVGGPYVISQAPDGWKSPWGNTSQPAATSAPPAFATPVPPDLSAPHGPGSEIYESPVGLAGPVGMPLEQAMHWGIDKNWVYRNWARKSTGLSDPKLFGVRVPLVTGSGMTDVAGSLTYYFDRSGVLQRMRLRGRTADTSRLVHLAATRFGMQPRQPLSPGDQLLQYVEGKTLRGELRTRPSSVLWATSPHDSFEVSLEVTRPGSDYVVTMDAPRLDLPEGPPASSERTAMAPKAAREAGSPFLPPRALIPDGEPTSSTPAGVSSEESPKASEPKPPVIGGPTKAPAPEVKPLDGYRDRFRWPG